MKRATREHEHAPFPPERHAPSDKTSKLRARRSNYAQYGLCCPVPSCAFSFKGNRSFEPTNWTCTSTALPQSASLIFTRRETFFCILSRDSNQCLHLSGNVNSPTFSLKTVRRSLGSVKTNSQSDLAEKFIRITMSPSINMQHILRVCGCRDR